MQTGAADSVTTARRRRQAAGPSRPAAWAPDLSLFLAAVTLVYTLVIFDGLHKLFRDSDAGWHIRTGERILASGELPRTDPYSFTRAGEPWIDWEWAADVAAGAAHRAWGLRGVALLFAVAIALSTWLWVRLTWAAGGDFLLASVLAAPMLSTANLHWLARPHVFGWALLVGWMWMLERGSLGSFSRFHALAAAVFGCVWANVHASFFLGVLTGLLYAAGSWVGGTVWEGQVKSLKRTQGCLLAALFFSLGSLLNPYGLALHRHVIAYLLDAELLARVAEFQTFNFHVAGAGWIVAAMGVAALGAAAALATRRVDRFLVIGFFVVAALRSARGLPLMALVALPLANAGFVEVLERAEGLNRRLRDWLDSALEYSARLRAIDRGFAGWALAPVLVALAAVGVRTAGAGFPADQFPVAASQAVESLPAEARILAPDSFGGYLIYRFNGARKVYFDGRSDFYGIEFMKEYLKLVEVRPGWRDVARRYRFTHALLPVGAPLADALRTGGWRPVYQDDVAALLEAPGTSHGS
ncbi:MAG: hypothetical protein JSU00_07880 [Acidobacteria bacterium]|nr:hypothetical protein [Acidobacteriota bacterium]